MSDLSQVKPGDYVMYSFGFSNDEYAKLKVAKVTKLHIITENGSKYRFSGSLVGSEGFHRQYIQPFDQALYDDGLAVKIHRKKANALTDTRWRDLPQDVVAKAYALLPKDSEAVK